VHFADLKRDMPGEISRIAEFLDITPNPETWDNILEHCGFDYMKHHATASVPLGGAFWDGGAQTFIHKGVNRRWAESLDPSMSREYEERAVAELGEEAAQWLAQGRG
jgi:aryl sulfotransferase